VAIACGVVSDTVGASHAELCRTVYVVSPRYTGETRELVEPEPDTCYCSASDGPRILADDWREGFAVTEQKLSVIAAGSRHQTQTAGLDEFNDSQRQNYCKEEAEKQFTFLVTVISIYTVVVLILRSTVSIFQLCQIEL